MFTTSSRRAGRSFRPSIFSLDMRVMPSDMLPTGNGGGGPYLVCTELGRIDTNDRSSNRPPSTWADDPLSSQISLTTGLAMPTRPSISDDPMLAGISLTTGL